MFKKILKNQDGVVLPIVFGIFLISVILGTAVLGISGADQRHSVHQDQKMQAYYLAKSGAETMATYLIEKSQVATYNEMNQLIIDISNKTSKSTNFRDGNFVIKTVKRTENGQQKLDIISTGNYRGVSDTVEATLLITIQSGADYNPTDTSKALVSLSNDPALVLQLLSSAYIEGDIMINATKDNSIVFGGAGPVIRNGSLYLPEGTDPQKIISIPYGSLSTWIENGVKFSTAPVYPSTTYPKPVFPEFPTTSAMTINGDFTTPLNKAYYISNDGYYSSITPSSGRTVTVDMNNGNRILRIGKLNLSGGNLELTNVAANSKLYLYVDTQFSLGSSWSLNGNGIPDNVNIYYAGSNDITINGASWFSANIFAKNAKVTLTAGANMKGNIVSLGTSIVVDGGSSANGVIIYAPNAFLEMGGSGQIKGAVIVKNFKRSGGSNAGIIYTPTDYSIPGDFFDITQHIKVEYDVNPWR